MNKEELYNFFKKALDGLEIMKKRGDAFHQKLSNDLFDLVFIHWPEMEQYRNQITLPLRELSEEYAYETMNLFNIVDGYRFKGIPVEDTGQVPKPLTDKDREEEFQALIKEMPEKYHESAKKVVWEGFENERQADQFTHAIHQKMKEALTDFIPEVILKFEAEHFLLLDDYLYHLGAYQFTQDFYNLEQKFEEEQEH